MKFYSATYREQRYKEGEWEYISHHHSEIIVLANNYEEAVCKIEHCLNSLNKKTNERDRAILIGNVEEVTGLNMHRDVLGHMNCYPVK